MLNNTLNITYLILDLRHLIFTLMMIFPANIFRLENSRSGRLISTPELTEQIKACTEHFLL